MSTLFTKCKGPCTSLAAESFQSLEPRRISLSPLKKTMEHCLFIIIIIIIIIIKILFIFREREDRREKEEENTDV